MLKRKIEAGKKTRVELKGQGKEKKLVSLETDVSQPESK